MPTRIDLIRLSPLAELEHLVAGGTTYRLWPDRPGAVLRLTHRNPEHIRAHPGRGMPMHDCAINHGPPDTTILTAHRPATTPTECPF